MNRYDSYKDSGVEWIGEIPKHWKNSKYKFHTNVLSGFPFKSELFDTEDGFPILRIRDVTSGSSKTYYKGEYKEEYVVKSGDLLIGMDGDYNIRWWDNYNVLLNQRCCSIKEFNSVLRRFLFYVLPFDLQIINDLTYYTTVKHLSNSDIYDSNLIVPPLSEQQQIVSFLDDKTQKIDSLKQQKEKKIELLKEKRTSLINHVVTKGLDSNVEMKDSGVEWIGEIPSGWNVSKFKYHSEIITGNTPSKTREEEFYTSDEDSFPWVKPSSLDKGFGYVTESVEYLTELGKNETRLVPKNSIMVCSIGNTLGKFGISGIELSTNQQINSVVTDEETLTTRYCMFFISVLTEDLIKWTNFVTLPIFTKTDFEDTEIIIPPLSEQQQIVEYLDKQTEEIETLIQLEQKKIETLKEYRQSLISEVVTGKIRVCKEDTSLSLNSQTV